MACPDENTLVAFASGELDATAHATVAAHIDGCDECASMVGDAAQVVDEDASPVISPTGETSPVGAPVTVGPLPRGTTVGRYVVLELLGSGGLGHVYTAYDPQLDRRVALKLLKRAGAQADAEAERWLLREAQAMAQLSHPHVVPVHDVGTHAGHVFVAMKLVDGGTLRDWLGLDARAWTEIRDVAVAAGQGLAAAHAAGLVHRDFKPTNVLVGDDGLAYVVDFGLARAVAGPHPSSGEDPLARAGDSLLAADLTQTGAIVGTPAYMAPEQLRGDDVDARADQFAFCVTLHEALFGGRPFTGRTVRQLLASIEAGPVRAEDTRKTPAWLRAALARGLAADPAARFGSMPELLHVLTADRRSRRRQWLIVSAVALVSAAGAGVAGFALRPQMTADERTQIETIAQRARAAAARASYVYPPADDPTQATAFVHVKRLESIEGPAQPFALEQAQALRTEFAGTLRRLGDAFAEREGGGAFAADYYAAAAVFDPDDAEARARMKVTPGQLADLAARAETLDFSAEELAAARALVVLALDDDGARTDALREWAADGDVPVTTRAQLRQLYPDAWPEAEPAQTKVAARQAPAADDELAADERPTPTPRPPRGGRRDPKPSATPAAADEPKAARDPEAAKGEVALGRQALQQGRTGEASTHFHRALELDSRSAAAASGLSELHFEQGQYGRAVKFGERAIGLAPKNAGYRIVLGDAYLNVLRYADARTQYDKAKALGHGKAASRLKTLDAKTGR